MTRKREDNALLSVLRRKDVWKIYNAPRIRATLRDMPKCNYPYIRAWGQMTRYSQHFTDDQIILAQKENAPEDAMWRGVAGKWHRFSEMSERNPNKALIVAYVKGNEDETV